MAASLRITYVGHATILIEMDGVRILTDPFLRNRVAHLRRLPDPVAPALYQDIDAVLLSHIHWDHFDPPSLRMVNRTARFIAPHGLAAIWSKPHFDETEEMQVGYTTTIGPVAIKATYADHSRARNPMGPEAECLGFLISGSYTVYFPGDTDIFPEMADLSDNIDVALMPVWGWGPNLGKGHLDPRRAAKALKLLRPRIATPIHWGTLYPIGMRWMKPRFLSGPPNDFRKHAGEEVPEVKVHIVDPGQIIPLEDDLQRGAI